MQIDSINNKNNELIKAMSLILKMIEKQIRYPFYQVFNQNKLKFIFI